MKNLLFVAILFVSALLFCSCGKTIHYKVTKKIKEGYTPDKARYILVMENEDGRAVHKVSYMEYYRYEVGDSIDWWYIF